jgi:hypothetical protein
VTDILGPDQFGRIIRPESQVAPEPDVTTINGRPAEPWETGSRQRAILANRERDNEILSGLVRS